jgi:hypothetical protein
MLTLNPSITVPSKYFFTRPASSSLLNSANPNLGLFEFLFCGIEQLFMLNY